MSSAPPSAKGSRLISRVLPVAVKFWLQTQLDDIGTLNFDIQATDRQVLSGKIPGIALLAQRAIYQGVQITDVAVQASDIHINIGQVLRGKALRLKQ
ncbi:MAG: LmeA family phospholipid-binding protein, partial [Cyanobacteria bacterium J06642_11]